MLLIMSHMKTVTLREFKHSSRYQRMAHDGQPILVTHRGKPYFLALPPEKAETFVGAVRAGKPLTQKLLDSVLPDDEWRSAR
jgi:antitoxin (DNA-binding transcriptional repressor) of toxin-antitoxin stability system